MRLIVILLSILQSQSLIPHFVWNKIAFMQRSKGTFIGVFSDQDFFDAEEAAAFDAHDISDPGMEAAVMERAVMLAHDLMEDKRQELNDQIAQVKRVEQQYIMMETATKDLSEAYTDDRAKFKKLYSKSKDSAEMAIQMIESVIAEAAQKMIEVENMQEFAIGSFFEAMEEEHLSEAKKAKAISEEQAARSRAADTEEFSDEDDLKERRRDMAIAHAARDAMTNENRIRAEAQQQEREAKLNEEKIKGQMAEMKESEQVLRDDLRELQEAIKEALVAEWENAKEQTNFRA